MDQKELMWIPSPNTRSIKIRASGWSHHLWMDKSMSWINTLTHRVDHSSESKANLSDRTPQIRDSSLQIRDQRLQIKDSSLQMRDSSPTTHISECYKSVSIILRITPFPIAENREERRKFQSFISLKTLAPWRRWRGRRGRIQKESS